nr:hypothetical protein [uncultured Pseudodesulfovibrio sp.]
MPRSRVIDRAESAWGRVCREVGKVFAQAFRLVLADPGRYGFFALLLFLLRKSSRLIPVGNMTGPFLHVTWWTYSIAVQLVTLGVMLSVILTATHRMRRERVAAGNDLFQRMGRALPYGFCLVFLFDQLYGFLAWGIASLGDMALGAEWGLFSFSMSYYLGALPFLFFLSRFGFTIVGPAVDDRVSFKDSWRISSPGAGAVFLTTLVWWGFKRLPTNLLGFSPYPYLVNFYFDWFHMPIQACVTILFGVIAAVWYERLKLAG